MDEKERIKKLLTNDLQSCNPVTSVMPNSIAEPLFIQIKRKKYMHNGSAFTALVPVIPVILLSKPELLELQNKNPHTLAISLDTMIQYYPDFTRKNTIVHIYYEPL